jgi:chromosome segregation ATPase
MQAITVRQLENTIAELTSVVSQLEIKLATKYSENGKEQAKSVGETANGMTDNLRDCDSSNEMHMVSNEVDTNSTDRGFERETQDLDKQNAGFLKEIEMLKESFQHQILDFQNEIQLLKIENDGQKEEIQTFQQQTVHLLNEIKSLKRESDGHKSVIASQKGQLKRLREKSTKVEEEYMAMLKQLEELKVSSDASSRDNENFTALKKQLETTQEHLLSTEIKYREMLQLTTCIDTEKSALLEVKKEAEATIAALQSVNASLQEDLRMEKLKSSGLQDQHDRDEDKLSVLIDEMTQLKLSEQEMVAQAKEMENKIRILQEENKTYRTRIEELETEIESDPASKTHLRGTMSELGIQKVRTLSELFKSQEIQLTRLDESFENETMENEKMDSEILCEVSYLLERQPIGLQIFH